jgi:hypothetical protein
MTNDDKRAFEGLLEDYVGLDESADIVVRQLRKISNPDSRRKVINELRNPENKRLELLDQMHRLAKDWIQISKEELLKQNVGTSRAITLSVTGIFSSNISLR